MESRPPPMGTGGSQIKLLPTRALSEDAAKDLSPWNITECVSNTNVVAAPESHLGRTLLHEDPALHASGQLCRRPQAWPAPTALVAGWGMDWAFCHLPNVQGLELAQSRPAVPAPPSAPQLNEAEEAKVLRAIPGGRCW